MADFRKLIYALALVALFIGVSTSANAQGMYCNSLTAAPQLVRAEGLTEYVGDIVLTCQASQAGVRTPAGNLVPAANVHVRILGTTITSRKTQKSGTFSEALLIVDEAGKVGSPAGTQLYCGKGGNDSGPSGKGVCAIYAPSDGSKTYDGQVFAATSGNDSATAGCTPVSTYGCGRPNIYQAKQDNPNEIVFPSVPMDPPGTNLSRTFRITNVRIDATKIDPASTTGAVAFVTIEGPASVTLQNTTVPVAFTQAGMGKTTVTADTSFLQCVAETNSNHTQAELIRISEGFRSAWKPKNVGQYIANSNSASLAAWLTSANQYNYSVTGSLGNSVGLTSYGINTSQNVPDAHWFAETNFNDTSWGTENGINLAGTADYGTRISFTVSNPPGGNTTLSIPLVAYLWNNLDAKGGYSTTGRQTPTGVMVMTSVTDTGTGAYTAVTSTLTGRYVIPTGGATVTYEVLFGDPGTIETARIDGLLTYTIPPVTSSNPTPITDAALGILTQVGTATFAPYYAAYTPNNTVDLPASNSPQFVRTTGGSYDFVAISKCSCSLLFPWVVGDNNYVTGFAVSNTSMDPSNVTSASYTAISGYSAAQQSGPVTMYYFGRTGTNPVASGTAAQTVSSPSANVPAGSFATFLSPSGFAGYAIANAQFQYCHGVAFLFSTTGAVPPMSYLGLVMDGTINSTTYTSQAGAGQAIPLQRTIQGFKDSLGH